MRRWMLMAVVLSAMVGSVDGQIGRGGGRGGFPVDAGPRPVQFSGRVIVDSTVQPDDIIEVRIENASGARVAFAYTLTSGEFTFRPVALEPGSSYFVVVEYDGHRTFRERLDQIASPSGGRITIFLSREPSPNPPPDPTTGNVVDIRQLAAVIPDEAYADYERAMEAVREGSYGDAIPRLERAVDLAPDFYEAQNALGGQYVRAGRYAEAEAALQRARELGPGAAAPLVNLGVLYYQEGQSHKDGGDPPEAARQFGDAVDALEEAIRSEPLSSVPHHYLGAALYELGDLGRAEDMLNRAIELDPGSGDPRLVLLNIFTRQQRYEAALEQIARYLSDHPDSPMRPTLEQFRGQIENALNAGRSPNR